MHACVFIFAIRYPFVERFFRLDFQTLLMIFQKVNKELVPMLRDIESCFEQPVVHAYSNLIHFY